MASSLPDIGGTGLVIGLYEYLWTKNNLLQTRCMYHKCPPVQVPDTIILKDKSAISWYFSSLKSGALQRRSKELSTGKATQALMKLQSPGTDIVCVFVGSAAGDAQPITEYLSKSGLEYFIAAPTSRRTKVGILQSFVCPKGTSNFVIRVTWTPESCTMDSCININKMSDPDLDIQERAATNDEKNCVLIPTSGNVIATQLEKMCACIADHLHLVSSQQLKVASMILIFKIDAGDRVWLLWCEKMEVNDDQGNPIRGPDSITDSVIKTSHPIAPSSTALNMSLNSNEADSDDQDEKPPRSSTLSRTNGSEEGDEEFAFGATKPSERFPLSGSSRDEYYEGEDPVMRSNSSASEGVEAMDHILIPAGALDRLARKDSAVNPVARSRHRKVNSSDDPASSTGYDRKDRRDPISRSDNVQRKLEAGDKQSSFRRQIVEEKRLREQAQQQILQTRELLKRSEAKANALKARLRLAEANRSAASEPVMSDSSEVSVPAGKTGVAREKTEKQRSKATKAATASLPLIPGHGRSRPSSQGAAQQAVLVSLEAADPVVQSRRTASASGMADAIARAADINAGSDLEAGASSQDEGGSGEEDRSALNELNKAEDEPTDLWNNDLTNSKTPKFYNDKELVEEKVVSEDFDEHESPNSAPIVKHVVEASGDGNETALDKILPVSVVNEDSPSPVIQTTFLNNNPAPTINPDLVATVAEEQPSAKPSDIDHPVPEIQETKQSLQLPGSTASASKPHEQSAVKLQPITENNSTLFDPDEYEDRPIQNAVSIQSEQPKIPHTGVSTISAQLETEAVSVPESILAESKPSSVDLPISPQTRTPDPQSLEVLQSGTDKIGSKVQDVNEFEMKGSKYEFSPDPSPIMLSSDSQRVAISEPVERNQDGDQVSRDERAGANQQSAHEFRSELRISTSFEKWNAGGTSTVMDGARIGSTVSVFGMGETGLTFSSMFDDDGLQPLHIRTLDRRLASTQSSSHPEDDLNSRCESESTMSKAVPDPVPDFHQAVECAQQQLSKESGVNQLELPLRKSKGNAEKKRENRIEMICMPMEAQDMDSTEDVDRLHSVFGLPHILWKQEEHRGGKFDPVQDKELLREANESRVVERVPRIKGLCTSQIDTISYADSKEDTMKRDALEPSKLGGDVAPEYNARSREACTEYAAKHAEWIYDEYLRPTDSAPDVFPGSSKRKEFSEVMEIKFDVAFSSDQERAFFAKTQRENLANLLGIPEHLIEVVGVKPGSPVTVVRFQIKAADVNIGSGSQLDGSAALQSESQLSARASEMPTLGISMLEAGDAEGHRKLSARLREVFGDKISVDDRSIPISQAASDGEMNLGSKSAYSREAANEMREQSELRTKGESIRLVPGSRLEDEANQHVTASGEYQSTPSNILKGKGATSCMDSDTVERTFKPGREIMQDDQFSSSKVQRRPPRAPTRLTNIVWTLESDLDELVKVPYEEVDNTRRLKEQEDELNFLPAQRSVLASRTTILAKKDEGLEDTRYDFLREHDHKKEEKQKDSATLEPSLKLTKAVEEIEYELAQKITGFEDPRTLVACEPTGLSIGDKRSKRKGKDGEKLSAAAIPEAYMAFGIEKESQRLAPNIVTLDQIGNGDGRGAAHAQKVAPELIDNDAPIIMQFKFDVSFIDQESRESFADAQRMKAAKLLRIPLNSIRVRLAVPGSPITIITFEIEHDSTEIDAHGTEPVFSNQPFDSPVLEVDIFSSDDNEAEILSKRIKAVLGPKVKVTRQSANSAKAGATLKEKNVKFDNAIDSAVQPAYMMSRAELQAKAMMRQKGALSTDKEVVEVYVDGENKDLGRRAGEEPGLDEKLPIVTFDRRLPKNSKNKQHLLSRIHTIESTLQRLYGKLEVDSELPDIESIEQLMSSTIKQTVYSQDQGIDEEGNTTEENQKLNFSLDADTKHLGTDLNDGIDPNAQGPESMGGDDAERRELLRAERRKRMEERDRNRSEKEGLDIKPRTGGTVRFNVSPENATSKAQQLKDTAINMTGEQNIMRLKELQDEDALALYPVNIPSVAVREEMDEEFADVSNKKLDALKVVASTKDSLKDNGMKSSRSDASDETMDPYELQQMAASGTDGWKAAFSKVRHGKRSDLLAMLDAGCPSDLKDETGNSLLNIAAQNGHKSIIKALLRRGASINTQNHNGQTPLHFCFTYGFSDLGNYLISKGADDTVQNTSGLTCYEGLGD